MSRRAMSRRTLTLVLLAIALAIVALVLFRQHSAGAGPMTTAARPAAPASSFG